MKHDEWKDLKQIEDKNNPLSFLYEYPDGTSFYIEPVFYTQLHGMRDHYPQSFQAIIDEMEKIVKKNKKVVFTGCFDNPLTKVDNYIFLEITDVTDRLRIFIQDISRPSDYGD